MIKVRSYPDEANPLPQTPSPWGLCPHTAELRLSSTLRAPLRSATPQRKEGFALFSLVDHALRSWSNSLTPCPHHRVSSIVTPFNMQRLILQGILPDGVKVGTVDKFQGQQAPVVIVSMCASEGSSSSRGIKFLFERNRLNVALSRASSLAIVVGHPDLAQTPCNSVDKIALVNFYCRIIREGSHG